jgi:hypothetical protein
MDLELYQEVALTHDVPEYGLHTGDIVTLIDFVNHPGGGEKGCVLEVFNAIGESIAVLTAPLSLIEPLHANEILTVRSLMNAG